MTSVRTLDYANIDEWSPWLDKIMGTIGPTDMIERLLTSTPEFIEDARALVVYWIGRRNLVGHLQSALAPYHVRAFHGTRVTEDELASIKRYGLRALVLTERRNALAAAFSRHPDWPSKETMLDDQIQMLGKNWEKSGAGKREDASVHACLSRAGLLYGCNHYLTHGAEVDQHIAMALFADNSGLEFLTKARKPYIASFSAPYLDAAQAANPYGVPSDDLPGLMERFLGAWAYRKSHPSFEVKKQRDSAALRFPAPILADRIERLELIDESIL